MRIRLALLLLSLAIAGCAGPEAPAPTSDGNVPSDPPAVPVDDAVVAVESAIDGAALFAIHCAVCHGPEGRGDGPTAAALDPSPVDLTGPRPVDKRGQPGGRRVVIHEGSPGTAMPPFAEVFSDEEMAALLGHVHRLRSGDDAQMPDHTGGPYGSGRGGGWGRGRGGGQGRGGGGGGPTPAP